MSFCFGWSFKPSALRTGSQVTGYMYHERHEKDEYWKNRLSRAFQSFLVLLLTPVLFLKIRCSQVDRSQLYCLTYCNEPRLGLQPHIHELLEAWIMACCKFTNSLISSVRADLEEMQNVGPWMVMLFPAFMK